jgi:branched-chain amino acid transport system substrate-binding protein
MRQWKLASFVLVFVVIVFTSLCKLTFGQPKPSGVKPPIKIGYIIPLTGNFAGQGTDMRDGFLLYLEQKGNRFAGRQIEVLVEDTEAKPDIGLTKAKKLVERNNVNILAGVLHSGVAYAVAQYVKNQKIPLCLHNAGADDLTQRQFSPYIFRSAYSNSQNTHPLGEWAFKKGCRKAAILASDYSAGYEYSGGFARTFTESGGQIVQELYSPMGIPDPGPYITAVKSEVDVVFAFHSGADGLRFVRRYDEYGLKKRTILTGTIGLTDSILPEEGDSALGIVTCGIFSGMLDNPGNKAFMAAFRRKYNRPPTHYAQSGYVGAMMLEKGLETVQGDIEDRENFIKAFEKVEIQNSPRGHIRFDKYHNIISNIYLLEVKRVDGKLGNAIVETYKDVSQFWKWRPEEYMKMPLYVSMKGKWVK